MAELNPYQAPTASLRRVSGDGRDVVWRKGNLMVVESNADLPHRCVKCNQPSSGQPVSHKVYWAPWWSFFRRRAVIAMPLCEQHRFWCQWYSWSERGGVFLLTFFVFLMMRQQSLFFGALGMLPVFVVLIASIFGRLPSAHRIEDNYIYLRRCDRAYLKSLPDFKD